MKSKKSQGMPVNIIIIAVIVLIVLVILIAIFTGRMGGWGQDLDQFNRCNEACKASNFKTGSLSDNPCANSVFTTTVEDNGISKTKYCCCSS